MNKTGFFIALLIITIGCNKADDAPVIPTTPSNPSNPGCNNCPVEEIADYKILDGFLGVWHSSTVLSADGNVITVGSNRYGNRQMLLLKTDTAGEIIFSTLFHQVHSKALGVFEDDAQNIYVTGYTYAENPYENRRLSAAKLDKNGNVIWEKTYHEQESITGYHISGLSENEIIISGSRNTDLIFLKIDTLGQELMFKTINSPKHNTPSGMLVLQNGNILITGYDEIIKLTCFDQAANQLWLKTYGPNPGVGRSTIQLHDGNLLTVGRYAHQTTGSNAIDSALVVLIKTDTNGELIWEKEVGDADFFNDGQSIAENADGKFVLTGYALSGHPSQTDHMLIFTDAEGNEISLKYFTDSKTFRGENIIKVAGGRNVITGGATGGTFFLNVDNYGME